MRKSIQTMSAEELTQAYHDTAESVLTAKDNLMKIGRSHEPINVIYKKRDVHSSKYLLAVERLSLIEDEIDLRMRYHGTRDPIPRKKIK